MAVYDDSVCSGGLRRRKTTPELNWLARFKKDYKNRIKYFLKKQRISAAI